MPKTRVKPELPQEIFVYREHDGNDSFLIPYAELVEAAQGAGEGVVIGTYVLDHEAEYTVDKTVNEV